MKKSKLITMIISLLAAVVFWIYVVTIVNPDGVEPFPDLPVTFSGEEALQQDQGLTITTGKDATVTVTFAGKNADLKKLLKAKDEITATVDVSKIRSARDYSLSYTITLPASLQDANLQITERSPSTVSFTVQKYVTRPVEVRCDTAGVEIAEGYMSDGVSFDYETISVQGPESVVNSISYALVSMNRTNLSNTVTEDLPFTLVDAEGNAVDIDGVSTDVSSIGVTLNIVKYKDVPLDVEFIDGGGATGEDVSYEISPAKITLSGDSSALDAINKLALGNIDLADTANNALLTFQIMIPDGAKNVSGEEEATVTLKIKNKATAVVRATNITFINVADGLSANSLTQLIQTTVRASTADITNIDTADLRVVADMADYTQAGTYNVPVTVLVDGYPDAGVVGDYQIVATITAGQTNAE